MRIFPPTGLDLGFYAADQEMKMLYRLIRKSTP